MPPIRTPVSPVRHLVRARDLADSRYTEPLTVDDLAASACLSRAHFSREFRRAFGESPYSYLLTRRLERAATLLRGTDYTVADICMQVGLTSVGSFTSSFTRAYGVLVSVQDKDFTCLHAQPKFNATYQSFRQDCGADLAYLSQKWR